jgi:branched-chain amino acid transport system permease protein
MRQRLTVTALVAVAALGAPRMVADPNSSYLIYVLFQALILLAVAQGWNLVAGYCGQISLGQHAFFGCGAYVTALVWSRGFGGCLHPVTMLLSGLSAATLAVLVGIPLLSRLKGDYFALGTIGLGEILRVAVLQGGSVTGGSSGLTLPSGSYASMTAYYHCGLAVAGLATVAVYAIAKSGAGLALVAIRESEIAAAASGIHTLRYKVGAFAACGFLAGLCGSLQAFYLLQVSAPSFFSLNWSLLPVIVCVLGGLGTVAGPVAGTALLVALLEFAKHWLPAIHPMLSGALIIVVVLFLPDGLLGVGAKLASCAGIGTGCFRFLRWSPAARTFWTRYLND